MPSICGEHILFAYAMIILVLNFRHLGRSVLEADLVRSSHLGSDGIAYTVEDHVEYINLLLVQRIFNGNTELVKLNLSENSAE